MTTSQSKPQTTITSQELRKRRRGHQTRSTTTTFILTAILATLIICALKFGETTYSIADIWAVTLGQTVPGASFTIGELRLPRTLLTLAVGLALGASGVAFQHLLRNTLASPDVIGVSATASAVGVFGVAMLTLDRWSISLLALVLTLMVAIGMYLWSKRGTTLILTGIGVGAFMQAIVMFVLSQAQEHDLQVAAQWLSGSLNGANWETAIPVAITVAVLLPIAILTAHVLGVLRCGEALATGLGVRVGPAKIAIIAVSTFLVAVATAAVGPIAFVAFMAGPIATKLPHRNPILSAALVGGILLFVADLVAQLLLPYRYPVGVVTGVAGAPFLIAVLLSYAKKA